MIERCFGQLKKRFPILGNCVRVALNNVPKVIVSCAVLHNVAKHLNDGFEYGDLNINPDEELDEILEVQHENADTTRRGRVKRNVMMQVLNIH